MTFCWSCRKDVKEEELSKVFRPFFVDGGRYDMECEECAKIPDKEYMSHMDTYWNEKISEEVNKEFEEDIRREYLAEMETENIDDD